MDAVRLERIAVRLKHLRSHPGRGRACPSHPDHFRSPLPTLPRLRGRVGRGRRPGQARDDAVGDSKRSKSALMRLAAITFSLVILAYAAVGDTLPARAQVAVAHRPAAPAIVPGFWDPRRRPERPDLTRLTAIRFMTEVDYPPFNFAGPGGNPAGFNVELARMVCEELKIACTVQMRRFDTLLPSLSDNRGDAVMASIAVTPEARKLADFSDPYYRTPGRFAARRNTTINDVRPAQLEGKMVPVVAGTADVAFHKAPST